MHYIYADGKKIYVQLIQNIWRSEYTSKCFETKKSCIFMELRIIATHDIDSEDIIVSFTSNLESEVISCSNCSAKRM